MSPKQLDVSCTNASRAELKNKERDRCPSPCWPRVQLLGTLTTVLPTQCVLVLWGHTCVHKAAKWGPRYGYRQNRAHKADQGYTPYVSRPGGNSTSCVCVCVCDLSVSGLNFLSTFDPVTLHRPLLSSSLIIFAYDIQLCVLYLISFLVK